MTVMTTCLTLQNEIESTYQHLSIVVVMIGRGRHKVVVWTVEETKQFYDVFLFEMVNF